MTGGSVPVAAVTHWDGNPIGDGTVGVQVPLCRRLLELQSWRGVIWIFRAHVPLPLPGACKHTLSGHRQPFLYYLLAGARSNPVCRDGRVLRAPSPLPTSPAPALTPAASHRRVDLARPRPGLPARPAAAAVQVLALRQMFLRPAAAAVQVLALRQMFLNDMKPRRGSEQHTEVPYGVLTGMLEDM
jgi:hypothetical protein